MLRARRDDQNISFPHPFVCGLTTFTCTSLPIACPFAENLSDVFHFAGVLDRGHRDARYLQLAVFFSLENITYVHLWIFTSPSVSTTLHRNVCSGETGPIDYEERDIDMRKNELRGLFELDLSIKERETKRALANVLQKPPNQDTESAEIASKYKCRLKMMGRKKQKSQINVPNISS